MKKAYFWSWLPYLAAIIIVPAVYDRLENPMMYTPPASSPPITVYASGSNYTMTNSSAAVDFSGIDPVVTLNSNDIITIYADVSTLPTLGSFEVSEASIVAMKI